MNINYENKEVEGLHSSCVPYIENLKIMLTSQFDMFSTVVVWYRVLFITTQS